MENIWKPWAIICLKTTLLFFFAQRHWKHGLKWLNESFWIILVVSSWSIFQGGARGWRPMLPYHPNADEIWRPSNRLRTSPKHGEPPNRRVNTTLLQKLSGLTTDVIHVETPKGPSRCHPHIRTTCQQPLPISLRRTEWKGGSTFFTTLVNQFSSNILLRSFKYTPHN